MDPLTEVRILVPEQETGEGMSGLNDATNFSFDVQELMQNGSDIASAIKQTLSQYPGAVVSKEISFGDGSKAILTTEGFIVS